MVESARKLSELYGFRNRFWRRSYRELLPQLKDLRRKLISESLEPIAIAIRASIPQNRDERSNQFFMTLAEAWNRKRVLGPIRLKGGQKVIFKKALSIVNLDGSVDLEKLKSIQPVFKLVESSVLEFEKNQITETEIELLLEKASTRITDENIDVIESLLNSSAGRILGGIVPGFPLLVTFASQFDRIKKGEFSDIWREIIAESGKQAGKAGLKRLMGILRASAAVTPASILLDVGIDRVSLQDALARRLEQRTETLKSLTQ